jgi:hypothetical protein
MRNPAPRANAGNRADRKSRTRTFHSTTPASLASPPSGIPMRGPIDFAEINRAALAAFPAVLARVLPGGKRVGAEIVALNPRRADRRLGSFKVNRYNGRWADFASGHKGGDPISLVAYLADVSQGEAARLLAQMLGLETGGRRHG